MYNELQSRVSVGMKVFTLDGEVLGHVASVHGDTFEVEKGVFFKRDYAAAFTEIADVTDKGIVLTVSQEGLEAMRASGRVGTSFADRASGVVDHAVAALGDAVHAVSKSRPPAAR